MRLSKYILGCFVLLLIACVPPSDEIKSDVAFSVADNSFQQIVEYGDRQYIDSLLLVLKSNDPTEQFLALKMLASIRDASVLDSIYPYLNDANMDVRAMTAYTIGQIGDEKGTEALIKAFIYEDTLDVDNPLNGNILEALGKISNQAILQNIATVSTYRPDDTLLLEGQINSIYQFGLRNIISEEGSKKALGILTDKSYPKKIRLLAAHYLARNKDLGINSGVPELLDILKREQDVHLRMATALAFQQYNGEPLVLPELKTLYAVEKDYRVKVFLLKAMAQFPYIDVVEFFMEAVKNPNIHVAATAAQFFIDHGNAQDAYLYKNSISPDMPWQVKSKIYQGMLKHTPVYYTKVKNVYKAELAQLIAESKDKFAKAAYIQTLSQDPYQYTYLYELLQTEKEPVVTTAIAETLTEMVNHPDFIKAYGGNYIRVGRNIMDTLIVHAKTGDIGHVVALANLLKNSNFNWLQLIQDSTWIDDITSKLKMPRDLEAMQELKTAIAKLEGHTYKPEISPHNKPIDWSILAEINDSSRIIMKTTKGNITLKLYSKEAPASVANFVQLCTSDYYDGKVFHRVVPNFVIQGGCPIGSGYGSLDYTIRSEVGPLHYHDEGYVGMASAGPHTESVQFFITHSPTPHLDGKYTILGKVVQGMDVVHEIQVGDQIIDAILTK